MGTFIKILNSNVVAAIVSLFGCFLTYWLSTNHTTREMEKSLQRFDRELERKVYVSSKIFSMEFETIFKLNQLCGEIFRLMRRLYPINMTTHELNDKEKPELYDLAAKIQGLESYLNDSRIFIPEFIIKDYEGLLEKANRFYADAKKHRDFWASPDKEDQRIKLERRNVANEAIEKFEKEWTKVGGVVRNYLLEKEKLPEA